MQDDSRAKEESIREMHELCWQKAGSTEDGERHNDTSIRLDINTDKFYRLLERSFGAVVIHSDYHVVFINDLASRLLGAEAPEEIIGKPVLSMVHEDHREMVEKRMRDMYETGTTFPLVEETFIRLDGQYIVAEVAAIGFTYQGKPSVLTVFRDVTQRKRRDEALRESEERFRHFFDQAPIGAAIVSIDFRFLRVNPEFCRITGYSEEELLSRCFIDITHTDDRDSSMENTESLLNGQIDHFKVDKRYVRKDGSIRRARTSVSLMKDSEGRPLYFLPLIEDITERKIAENELRESQRFLSTLLSNLPGMAFRCRNDRDWNMEYLSDGCFELTGYEPSDLIAGHKLMYNDMIHPDDREYVWHSIQDAIQDGRPYKIVYRIYSATGKEKWVWEEGRSISPQNSQVMLEGFVTDITDRKHVEQALHEAKAQAELYLDLMCHDINNMNQIGLGFLELALDTLDLDENARSLISKPLGAFESSSRLIDNVRKLQKIRSGELRGTKMDIGNVLMDVHHHYSNLHIRDVTIHYTPISGYVVMANELLYDVFSNLVGNAIKHSSGRPAIDIGMEKVTEDGTGYYIVRVEDNGPGIPEDLKRLIFYRHLRGSRKAKGSGIGLYLVKTLVDEYRGKVWVEDRIAGDRSKGSRFVVKLPAAEK